MPETDTIPVSASVASTGKGIRYIGNRFYAYSGAIATADSELVHLEFTVQGSGFIVGRMQTTYLSNHNENYLWKVYLNEVAIGQIEHTGSESNAWGMYGMRVVAPSQTRVKITCIGTETPNTNDMGTLFTGRVYGEE